EVTLYVADRPVAHFNAATQPGAAVASGHYRLRHNGPHWLLVKRGLAWAVSTPIWVCNQPVESGKGRAELSHHSAVQENADALRCRVDWLAALEATPEQTPYPVAHYVEWLQAQLPTSWAESDPAFSGLGDPVDWAMRRLRAAQEIVMPIVHD